mmetsp:Transcript_1901/g.1700  ORF Transcript_1901/g.1700 Transcript_1901/m.1700 type:complete len:422 (-) Transcript_1901:367-1632(-)
MQILNSCINRHKKYSKERNHKLGANNLESKSISNSDYKSSGASRQSMYRNDLDIDFNREFSHHTQLTKPSHAVSNVLGMQRRSLPLNQRVEGTPIKKEKVKKQNEQLNLLKNVGQFEKENRTLLKSNILSIRNMLENELTLDISLGNEYGENLELNNKVDSKEDEIRNFIKSASVPIDQLQSKLNSITKESKDSQRICEYMKAKTKDDALRIMYETIKLVEVLWNQMIAYETTLIYKFNNHVESNQFSKTMVSELDNVFKGFDSFLRNRTISYKKVMEKFTKYIENDMPSTKIGGSSSLTRSISRLQSDLTNFNSTEKFKLEKIDLSRSSQGLMSNKLSSGIEHYKPKLEPINKKLEREFLKETKYINFNQKSFKSIKKDLFDCKGCICTDDFLKSIISFSEESLNHIPDLRESIKDKEEE